MEKSPRKPAGKTAFIVATSWLHEETAYAGKLESSHRAHSLALRDLHWCTGEISTRRFMVLLLACSRFFRDLVFYHENAPGLSLLLRSSIRPLYHLS